MRNYKWSLMFACIFALPLAGHAEDGVYANRIVFGQGAALTGPSAALGIGMREGLLAAFTEANRHGGVKGHSLQLLSLDDAYDPDRAIDVARELIKHDRVFALIGSVGTPTSVAVQPIAEDDGIPFIGAFSGAEFLRVPYKHTVINIRASYFQETEAMVDHLVRDTNTNRIAVFFQDDAFGRSGLAGVKRAMARRNLQLVAEGAYARNTVDVAAAVSAITAAKPQAVIMIGTYKPSAAFIRQVHAAKLQASLVNISFVGADSLARELGQDGAGVIVAEVVPFPNDPTNGLVARYRTALHSFAPRAVPSYVSLEGYMVGRLVTDAIGKIPGPITRASLLDTVASAGTFDLDGFTLAYSPTGNRGSTATFFTILQQDGTLRPIERFPKQGI